MNDCLPCIGGSCLFTFQSKVLMPTTHPSRPWFIAVRVFLGYRDGTFAIQTIYSTDAQLSPYSIAIGDFDNDNLSGYCRGQLSYK
ncbi:unnamed protein product [Rotaria magnacalcarata]|uniref:Uncharacterized protein n=1 Tax=Rotaria magnacalcarata TaxID=392030 RepID=A0A819LG33_9BILA|nr:unnamed protein product [Rotaria magnacalcarata]